MPEATTTIATATAPAPVATLSSCCDIAERILHAGFQQLQTSPTTWDALDKAVDILARLTAVRKSLIHLSDKVVGRVSDPTPKPSSSDNPADSPSPDSEHAVARASARDNQTHSSSTNSSSTDSPSPDPDSDNRQSPDPSIASVASVASISEIHSIRSIPAMPLDRIAGALNRVIADIMRHRAEWQRRSPERQNHPSPNVHPAESNKPHRAEWQRRSPERQNHPSPDAHPAEPFKPEPGAHDSGLSAPLNSS